MQNRFFEWDGLAFVLMSGCALLLFFCWRHPFFKAATSPSLAFSNLKDLQTSSKSLKAKCARLPHFLKLAALFLFMVAFIDPHLQTLKKEPTLLSSPTEGIAIYLVLDRSSSMNEKITTYGTSGKRITQSKLDLLKEVTAKFIQGDSSQKFGGRPNDLIGLVVFARRADIVSPLTLDHTLLLEKLPLIAPPANEEQNGTAIGYAIFKTVNLIAATRHYANDLIGADLPAYDLKNSIIVLVTDGLQAPNPLDNAHPLRSLGIDEAAEYAKKNEVKLYIINLEPRLNTEELAPFRRQMEKAAQLTGGKLFLLASQDNLGEIYRDLDQLEKSTLPTQEQVNISHIPKDQLPQLYKRLSLYPYFIALGMIFLLVAALLKTTLLRTMP